MHVVLHRCDKGILVDNEAEAIVEDEGTFQQLTDGGEREFKVATWDGDTIVHEEGRRFEVYELVRKSE
jgi:hypothetical protein